MGTGTHWEGEDKAVKGACSSLVSPACVQCAQGTEVATSSLTRGHLG